jgi:hypothetical protein
MSVISARVILDLIVNLPDSLIWLPHQFRQFGDICRNPPRLVIVSSFAADRRPAVACRT